MTLRDDILTAIVARIAATSPAPASIEVDPAGDPDRFDAVEIHDEGDTILGRQGELTRKRMSLEIVGIVEGEGGDAPTVARNELHARVVAAIVDDGQLGGLVELIEEGDRRNVTAVLAERRRNAFSLDIAIEYAARRDNPALPA